MPPLEDRFRENQYQLERAEIRATRLQRFRTYCEPIEQTSEDLAKIKAEAEQRIKEWEEREAAYEASGYAKAYRKRMGKQRWEDYEVVTIKPI
jgi:hypothetical protein